MIEINLEVNFGQPSGEIEMVKGCDNVWTDGRDDSSVVVKMFDMQNTGGYNQAYESSIKR